MLCVITSRRRPRRQPVAPARDLVGLHGTDPASVFFAGWARTRTASVAAVERTLYDDPVLVRILGMRQTMFVVPLHLASAVWAASPATSPRGRGRLVQLLEQAGIATDGGRRLREVEAVTLRGLQTRGEATAAEAGEDEPSLSHR